MALLLLWSLGAGCGYGSYYPSPISADSGGSDTGGTLPCPEITQRAVDLYVTNARADAVTVSKMELDCVEQYVTSLPPGADRTEPSLEGAVFVFRDPAGGIVDVLQLPGDQDPYVLVIH